MEKTPYHFYRAICPMLDVASYSFLRNECALHDFFDDSHDSYLIVNEVYYNNIIYFLHKGAS